jgi:lysozyme
MKGKTRDRDFVSHHAVPSAFVGTRRIRSLARLRSMLASLVSLALAGSLLPIVTAVPAHAQTTTLGIDVSHWQGTIDWNQVADSGHVFAFQKATEGATFTDSKYSVNRAGAADASIPFGAYHFARPDGATIAAAQTDAVSEAQYFLAVAQPAPGELVPVLDMEATGGLPPQRLIAWTQAWLDTVVAALGVKPLVYTSPNFWKNNLNDTKTFAEQGFPLWIAHYTSAASPTVPAANWNGEGWSFWQWTNCASIPGISGCVDEDRFPGSDLSPYTIPGAPQPEPTPEPATPPSNESPPVVSGETEVGRTLTATEGTWSGTQPLSYSYSWYRCDADGAGCSPVLNGTEPTYELVPADYAHRMKVMVTATNSAGSSSQDSSVSEVVTDTTAPAAPRMTKPRWKRTLATTAKVAWRPPEQGITSYDVRFRSAPRSAGFGGYAELVGATTETSATIEAQAGTTYCFSSRATDEAGNVSGWSSERCTVAPLDDRDLKASSSWARRSRSRFYLGTFMKAKRRGAALVARNVRVRDIPCGATLSRLREGQGPVQRNSCRDARVEGEPDAQ